jgi:Domain of unknown function (DUF4124)
MKTKNAVAAIVAGAALLATALCAQAQQSATQHTYRCTDKDGKKYYGQTMPQACLGQPLELINKQGLVVKRIDPEGDERARLAKEAEAEKKRELEAAQKDAQRRNRALLATYTSEKDIEEARARDLRNHDKGVQEVQKRVDDIKKRQAQFQKELDLFKTEGKGQPPTRLKEEITNAEIDLKAQETLLDAKKKEAVGINARYDEDKRRYKEATGRK